jgi:ATP-binding cassette subfamily F protein uup
MLFLDPDSPPAFYKNFTQILSAAARQGPGSGKQAAGSNAAAASGSSAASRPAQKASSGAGNATAGVPRPTAGSRPAFSYRDKYELEHMEDTILTAEAEVDPEIMADPKQLADVCRDLEKAETRVQALYARWEELEQKKAAAEK